MEIYEICFAILLVMFLCVLMCTVVGIEPTDSLKEVKRKIRDFWYPKERK